MNFSYGAICNLTFSEQFIELFCLISVSENKV